MIRNVFTDIFYGRKRTLAKRKFLPKLFLSKVYEKEFENTGAVLVPDALSHAELNGLRHFHSGIVGDNRYKKSDRYFGSFAFPDSGFRNYIREETSKILQPVFTRFFDAQKAIMPLGGGYCINPAHSKMGCYPHQDPNAVDEAHAYTLTMWIALSDMAVQEGCLHVLRGSHLWGNHLRATNIPWAFSNHVKELWNYMEPVAMKAGDILFFDLSLIHASTPNTTPSARLGLNVPVFSAATKKIWCYPSKKKNATDIYEIDNAYFADQANIPTPLGKYPLLKSAELSNYYSAKNIRELIREYRTNEIH